MSKHNSLTDIYIGTYLHKYTQKNTHDPTVADHDFIFRASLIKTFAISFGRRLSTDLPASQKAQRNATQLGGARKVNNFFNLKNKSSPLFFSS